MPAEERGARAEACRGAVASRVVDSPAEGAAVLHGMAAFVADTGPVTGPAVLAGRSSDMGLALWGTGRARIGREV